MQQQQLQTQQAMTTANLNLEENAQRKSILNSMLGTRVFRGSPLSRALVGNTPGTGGENATGAPSASQQNNQAIAVAPRSILDTQQAAATGATPAGGAGASGSSPGVTIVNGTGRGSSVNPGNKGASSI